MVMGSLFTHDGFRLLIASPYVRSRRTIHKVSIFTSNCANLERLIKERNIKFILHLVEITWCICGVLYVFCGNRRVHVYYVIAYGTFILVALTNYWENSGKF